jgi:hypothetical protein
MIVANNFKMEKTKKRLPFFYKKKYQIIFILLVINIIVFLTSCKEEIVEEEKLTNVIYYKDLEIPILHTGQATYFGKKLTIIEFGDNLSFEFADLVPNSIPPGEYNYGSINNGFRIYINYLGETIKAKYGKILIDGNPSSYTFEIDALAQDEQKIEGVLKQPIIFKNKKNSFIYSDSIYTIANAFGIYENEGKERFNYVYLFSDISNLNEPWVGVIFYGNYSGYLTEGNYAWGGQFGGGISLSEDNFIESTNGNLYVELIEENDEIQIYDVYFAMTCNESLKGEFLGQIPVYNVKNVRYDKLTQIHEKNKNKIYCNK